MQFYVRMEKIESRSKEVTHKDKQTREQNKSRKMWNERSIKERKNLWFNMCVNVNFTHNFFFFYIQLIVSTSVFVYMKEWKKKKMYKQVFGVLREREKFITEWVWAKHRTAFWLVSIFYFHFSGYSSKSKSSRLP